LKLYHKQKSLIAIRVRETRMKNMLWKQIFVLYLITLFTSYMNK